MFEHITPEQAGVDSRYVAEYLASIRRKRLPVHSILMMKGDKIFAEYYWEPFHRDFCHRMYSQTKSYVGIAIGLLEEEGKLSLSDPIIKYFPDKIDAPEEVNPYLANQTIEHMLTMCTVGECSYWFTSQDQDRTHLYLNRPKSGPKSLLHPAGTTWQYDSPGSQVLSSLVERLSGKSLFDYLNEKLFQHMGTFQTASILQVRNGDSWGDSALLCTSRDMASFGRLLMQGGNWNGKQLIPADYVRRATSPLAENRESAYYDLPDQGYGYQIWVTPKNGFGFMGMGNQHTLCLPDQDLLFVCTADGQGYGTSMKSFLLDGFYDLIVEHASDTPLTPNAESVAFLEKEGQNLKLTHLEGKTDSPFRCELEGAVYQCEENPMGLTQFFFTFDKDNKTGILHYQNAQGEKELPFGLSHNLFGEFPQTGYSQDRGGLRTTDGSRYKDAVSAIWAEEKKLLIQVQIIDRYFGNCTMTFAFRGNDATIKMCSVAEDFLMEYRGLAVAHRTNA